jgi:hypothetical protein
MRDGPVMADPQKMPLNKDGEEVPEIGPASTSFPQSSKPSWRSRLLDSLKRRKEKLSDTVTLPSSGSVDVETARKAIAEYADGLPSELRGGTPLHYYVWEDSPKKGKTDFLVSLLTTGEVEVDSVSDDGNTSLHLAVKHCL